MMNMSIYVKKYSHSWCCWCDMFAQKSLCGNFVWKDPQHNLLSVLWSSLCSL